MFRTCSLIFALIIVGCSTDALVEQNTLDSSLASKQVVLDNVIACAATSQGNDKINVFFYPRTGATNFQYFETESSDDDKNDFSNYVPVLHPIEDVFNGFLKKFEITAEEEKWVIVAFDQEGKTHLSNPIRLKQNTKPTEYLPQNITFDLAANMPSFSWADGRYDDSVIYFQVISDAQNNLISGTYTFDKMFRFYNLDNVVLNITKGTPDALTSGVMYNFSLMAVSEDNWVNMFAERSFNPQ